MSNPDPPVVRPPNAERAARDGRPQNSTTTENASTPPSASQAFMLLVRRADAGDTSAIRLVVASWRETEAPAGGRA